MSPQDKCKLSFYRDLEPIADTTKDLMVRNTYKVQFYRIQPQFVQIPAGQ